MLFYTLMSQDRVTSTLWTPVNLTTEAEVWLDASDASTITHSSNSLTHLADKTSNGNDFFQPTSSFQPTTNVSTQNGLNVIDYDADYLQLEAGGDLTGIKSFVFVCGDMNGSDTASVIAPITGQSAGSEYIYLRTNDSGSIDISVDGGSADNTGYANWNGGTLAYGGDINLGLTETEIEQWSVWYADLDNAAPVSTLGRLKSGTTNYRLKGSIGEIIIMTYIPSTSERQKLEGYLAHKWGLEGDLPSGHPYKSSPPYA